MADSGPVSSPSPVEEHEIEYRSVEPWALIGLGLGVVSSASLLGSVLLLVPVLGIVASVIALRRLRLDENHIGRTAALGGLALSVLFAATPAAYALTSYVILSRQGRPVADQWLEYLREGSPEKALMLRYSPAGRQPVDDFLWTYYRHDKEARQDLQRFVKIPAVRTLLALGPKATIRFYKTASVATDGPRGMANYYYTVTYPDGSEKKTFFLAVVMERLSPTIAGVNPWRVIDVRAGFDPNESQAK